MEIEELELVPEASTNLLVDETLEQDHSSSSRRLPRKLARGIAGTLLVGSVLAWVKTRASDNIVLQAEPNAAISTAATLPTEDHVLWLPVKEGHETLVEGGDIGSEQTSFLGCRKSCAETEECNSFSYCQNGMCYKKSTRLTGTEATIESRYCTTYMGVSPSDAYRPVNPVLLQPSAAPVQTFYMYRAQGDTTYPPENVNLASLGGVLWYVHNEVACHCPRRFDITRILRYKVHVKATTPLLQTGRHFGIRYSFDSGKCTGPWDPKKDTWDKYGYVVGCNDMVHDGFPFPSWLAKYPKAAWYSIPGKCSSRTWEKATWDCKALEPGGVCNGIPTGQGNCTFSYEDAGSVNLDDIVGIGNHTGFCEDHCREYSFHMDGGSCGVSWWDDKRNVTRNQQRMDDVDAAFKRKYPSLPSEKELPPPVCDFDRHTYFPPDHIAYLQKTLEEVHAHPHADGHPWTACVRKYGFYDKK
eukprot:TRINITY_DN23861_c0_g1_i1.p1 TRINITY_DN23861_c0_g1~~TRINITY_DN23861_c0_g1_i1.p1  ORF type:complete len:470 (+),score=47.81 TRINITY_DN23861_c0_g1_i1:60-1469(+)